jgi:hypothetical protein
MNKVNGILAEIDLRKNLVDIGFDDRISQGGWIIRNTGTNNFGEINNVIFPMTISVENSYKVGRTLEEPQIALHTICSTMHQIGIHSYFAVPSIGKANDASSIVWSIKQLGIPSIMDYNPLSFVLQKFELRKNRYNFLKYDTDAEIIPAESLPEVFTKEHLRISIQNSNICEMSDIDGIFWGQQHTYPLEIKEKTVAHDKRLGDYFGIDVGPFVKLAFYAAKKGNLHSLYFVREIDNMEKRNLVQWWYITFDKMALFASWVPINGGRSMAGGSSSVVKIPKSQFTPLNSNDLGVL